MLLFISHCHRQVPGKCNKHTRGGDGRLFSVYVGVKVGWVGGGAFALQTQGHANSAYCPLSVK